MTSIPSRVALLLSLCSTRSGVAFGGDDSSVPRTLQCASLSAPALIASRPDEVSIAVLRIAGSNAEDDKVGGRLSESLTNSLAEYASSTRRADIHGTTIQVRTQPYVCTVISHAEAREFGARVGADIVLWGRSYCTKESGCENVSIDGSVISAKGKVTIVAEQVSVSGSAVHGADVTVRAPETLVDYFVATTVVALPNVYGSGKSARIGLASAAASSSWGFPRLATTDVAKAVRLVIGVEAFLKGRWSAAAQLLSTDPGVVFSDSMGALDIGTLRVLALDAAGEKQNARAAADLLPSICSATDRECEESARASLAQLCVFQGDLSCARANLDSVLRLVDRRGAEPPPEYLTILGALQSREGSFAEARDTLLRSMKLSSEQGSGNVIAMSEAYAEYCQTYLKAGDWKGADHCYSELAPEKDSENPYLIHSRTLMLAGRAESRFQLGNWGGALTDWRKEQQLLRSIGETSRLRDSLTTMALASVSRNDHAVACDALQAAEAIGGVFVEPEVHMEEQLSTCAYCLMAHDLTAALAGCDSGIQLARDTGRTDRVYEGLATKAQVLSERGDVTQAALLFERAFLLSVEHPEVHYSIDPQLVGASGCVAAQEAGIVLENIRCSPE